jgi:dTDP-4-amino-4,6-dideoxygalactose transaminase
MRVPFNKPVQLPQHLDSVRELLDPSQLAGNGPVGKLCELVLEKTAGVKVRLTTSATHALEMMALLLDIKPGDEVIVPSFTFVSTANAFALRGARIRFADNDENGNILVSEVERLAGPRTRAVLLVDYAGATPDVDALSRVCEAKGLVLLEDAAQGIGATYKGRPLGTLGHLGCYSFHDTKNVTAGEGGALLLRDAKYLEEAEIIREKGTNRSKFFQGLVDKYTWVGLGSSYILSELNAAYLLPQLKRIEEITKARKRIWETYESELGEELAMRDAQILRTPAYNTPNYHIFGAVFPSEEQRNRFIADMKAENISCVFHYIPLHTSPFGARFADGGHPESLPHCEKFSRGLVRFPLFYNMADDELERVVDKTRAWLKK